MKLTYIFHSCFALETDRCILIFDYWKDPSCAAERILRNASDKYVYVFASHFHEDHFTKKIFQWRNNSTVASNDVAGDRYTYILSKDILKHKRAEEEDADVWLAKGDCWEDRNIKVIATGSNDSGVSWIVNIEEKRIFHAGDLCNWYARFLATPIHCEKIYSTESGKFTNPVAEEKRFLDELKDIREITGTFDIALFPVDGRIGNGYTLGGRQFIERFKVELFVPMHFVASGFESAWRMEPFCKEKSIRFWNITEEGESIEIHDNILIRQSRRNDISQLMEIFSYARRFMKSTGNHNQWPENYPDETLITEDIMHGDSYVCIQGRDIVATFVLREGRDPTYDTIYDGAWINDHPYATIHRIAGNGKAKGIFRHVMQYAMQHYETIRIDTHRDNKIMQHAINKAGFRYCGIIHCHNGEERLAYQYDK
ncbi:MAG: hypothetical protein NC116_11280 [Clostridium sp.]|nr:hypothetical protein [Clostridium sp.]